MYRWGILLFFALASAFDTNVSLAESVTFDECSASARLAFRHVSPISHERHLHLFMGSGLAWADLDRDGVLDLLFCQGVADPTIASTANSPLIDYWRGDISNGAATYRRTTDQARFSGTAYAMGICVADYDNDGFADLFVTGFFCAALYHNNGDGSFTNRTAEAGIQPSGFGTGCCWVDVDGDQNLDLVYVRYVKLDPRRYPLCTVPFKGREIAISCNPKRFAGDRDTLYRSQSDGQFEDISAPSGFSDVPARHGLGCVALDLDDDHHAEIYVANDGMPNDLWKSTANGRLQEQGMLAGVAVNRFGAAEAGMGIAVGDLDGDLRPELFVTNYFDETNTLYRNEGGCLFLDVTDDFGIAAPSRKKLGFGANFADFDNDGWLDLFVANGHVQDQLSAAGISDQSFAQQSQLFANRQGRKFDEISSGAGLFFQKPWVGRGSAAADFDNDGKIDLAVLRLNDHMALLRNTTSATGHWLSIDLCGRVANRDAIGATVLVRSENSAWRRDRMSSASYLSCDSPSLHFGLGDHPKIDSVLVRWPSGDSEQFTDVPVDRRVQLVQGTGTVVNEPGAKQDD